MITHVDEIPEQLAQNITNFLGSQSKRNKGVTPYTFENVNAAMSRMLVMAAEYKNHKREFTDGMFGYSFGNEFIINRVYPTVVIGDKVWTTQSLDVEIPGRYKNPTVKDGNRVYYKASVLHYIDDLLKGNRWRIPTRHDWRYLSGFTNEFIAYAHGFDNTMDFHSYLDRESDDRIHSFIGTDLMPDPFGVHLDYHNGVYIRNTWVPDHWRTFFSEESREGNGSIYYWCRPLSEYGKLYDLCYLEYGRTPQGNHRVDNNFANSSVGEEKELKLQVRLCRQVDPEVDDVSWNGEEVDYNS